MPDLLSQSQLTLTRLLSSLLPCFSTRRLEHPHRLAPSDADLLSSQWRQVQALADIFWTRWKREYLPTLEGRRKWHVTHHDLKAGDVVLLKDDHVARNKWPMASVTTAFPDTDGRVCKVELKNTNRGTPKTFFRPISQVVLLLPVDDGRSILKPVGSDLNTARQGVFCPPSIFVVYSTASAI